jgi:hypothetical protein
MGQATSNGRSSYPTSARRRKGARVRLAVIALVTVVCFAAGFILLWSLGSVIVGGKDFLTVTAGASISPVALQSVDHPLEPLVDLPRFGTCHTPVKGIYADQLRGRKARRPGEDDRDSRPDRDKRVRHRHQDDQEVGTTRMSRWRRVLA